ncbi:hypothetical protein [Dyella terrae]|nr:hypothetical protein [Dyella terrae]
MLVLGYVLTTTTAQACRPLPPEYWLDQFVLARSPLGLAFRGKVTSVSERPGPDGTVIRDTMFLPMEWWRGFRAGEVDIRTVSTTQGPCPGLYDFHPAVGEEWLIAGLAHKNLVESWIQPEAQMTWTEASASGHVKETIRKLKATP